MTVLRVFEISPIVDLLFTRRRVRNYLILWIALHLFLALGRHYVVSHWGLLFGLLSFGGASGPRCLFLELNDKIPEPSTSTLRHECLPHWRFHLYNFCISNWSIVALSNGSFGLFYQVTISNLNSHFLAIRFAPTSFKFIY